MSSAVKVSEVTLYQVMLYQVTFYQVTFWWVALPLSLAFSVKYTNVTLPTVT